MLHTLALLACVADPRGGTAVGNPTGLSADTAPSQSIVVNDAEAVVAEQTLMRCDGTERETDVSRKVSLLGGALEPVELSDACSLVVRFDAPLVFDGGGPGHMTFHLELDVPEVEILLDDPVPDVSAAVIQFGQKGWTASLNNGHNEADYVVVVPGDDKHDALADAIRYGSTLYVDRDADGLCTGGECDAEELGAAGE